MLIMKTWNKINWNCQESAATSYHSKITTDKGLNNKFSSGPYILRPPQRFMDKKAMLTVLYTKLFLEDILNSG